MPSRIGLVTSRAALSSMSGSRSEEHFSDVAKAAQAEAAATYGLQLTADEASQLAKVALAFARAKLQPQFVPTRVNYSAAVKIQAKRDTKLSRDRMEEQRIRALALKRLGRVSPYYPLPSTSDRFMPGYSDESDQIAASVVDDRQTTTSLISDIKRRIADQAAKPPPAPTKFGPDGRAFRPRPRPLLPNRLITTGQEFHPMNVWVLSRFLHRGGGMLPRKQTGLTHKQQRQLAKAVKRARQMAFMPYQTQFHMGPLGNVEDEVFPNGAKQHALLPPIRIVEHTEIVAPRQVLRYRSATRIAGNAVSSASSLRAGSSSRGNVGTAVSGAAALAASSATVASSGPVVYKRRSVPFGGSNKVTIDFGKPSPAIVIPPAVVDANAAAAADVAAGAARAVAAAAAAAGTTPSGGSSRNDEPK